MDACQRKRYLLRFIFLLVVFLSCIQYVDADCSKTTPGVHTFGSECQYMCHCKNGESCDTTTGECTLGCDRYWFGPGCQYRDLAENEYTRHASNLVNRPYQFAPRGNDGNISTCSNTTEADSSTVIPWWRVILKDEVTITDIYILTTTDVLQFFREFEVTVEKLPYSNKGSHDKPPDTSVCYKHDNTIPDSTSIHVTCTTPLIGNQVRITLSEKQSQLIVCDFRLNQGRNLAFRQSVTSSAIHQNHLTFFQASFAVNGLVLYSRWRECFVTGTFSNKWLQVEFDRSIDVYYFNVTTLKGRYDYIDNYRIYDTTSVKELLHDSGSDLSPATHGYLNKTVQKITIEKTTGNLMVICELELYGDCPVNQCGYDCSKVCHCKSMKSLEDKISGICTSGCEERWTGESRKCDVEWCESNKWGINCEYECGACRQGTCDFVTGNCTGGCQDGYINTDDKCKTECAAGKYGQGCAKDCSINCNDVCHHVSGTCTSCKPGWNGTHCITECQAGKYGQDCARECSVNCNDVCHHVLGTCTSCKAGWKGNNCSTECSVGYFGDDCNDTCSENCDVTCHHVDGSCTSCKPGWNGNYCNTECQAGKYGQDCARECSVNCNDVCHHVLGTCTSCKAGWKGNNCSTECSAGYFGKDCNDTCSENCDATCYHVDGSCTSCKPGWKGNYCNTAGKYGQDCAKECSVNGNDVCYHVLGTCTSCKAVWNGKKCSTECSAGYFGEDCNNTCSENCDATCYHVDGSCTSCKPGWNGNYCNTECSAGYFGKDCNDTCSENCDVTCHHVDGSCTSCKPGWNGNYCNTGCNNGSYGVGCKEMCNSTCLNFCDKFNGVCSSCITGWIGDFCEQECEDGSYGDYCREQCGYCKNDIACDKINGSCHKGCDSGFEGPLCASKIVQPQPPDEGFPVAAIAGIVSAVVGIVIIVVIVFIVIRRRSGNKNNGYTESTDNTETGWRNVSDNHENYGSDVRLHPTASSSKTATNTEKGDENEYYVFGNAPVGDKSSTAIALNNLTHYVNSKIANVDFFNNEFQDIPYGLQHPTLNATKPSNMGKNRYKELFAYDHARVVLKTLPYEPNSDYINASYIKGYKKDRAYIAAQGPTENNENEFWRMVWENNVNLIVMLTKLIEETKKKCVQYWTEKGNSKTFGKVTVFTESEEEFAEFTVRRLKITYDGKREERIVTHYIYTAWPDKTIPHSTCSLLQFWHKVRKHDADKTKPWLIHCSAGVGRTGTFIALDYLYDQGVVAGFIDINVCVRQLRDQRVNMVQVKEQYRYLYRIMIEALILPSTPILVHNFDAYYTDLLMIDQKTRQPKLKLQFETLSQTDGLVKDTKTQQYACKDAKLAINKAKNRYSNILASDEFRPFMSTHVPGTTDYINAIYMPSYSDLFSYIITQSPLPDTAVDCCRLIIDHGIPVVVTFNDDGDNEVGVYLPSKGSIEVGPFEVTSNNEEVKHGYIIRRHTLTFKSKKHEVVHVVCQNWPTNKLVPDDPSTMLQILQETNDLQRHYENKPVLLQCLNGAERSGLFVVLLNIIERSRIEEEVSIVQVVRYLRSRRPQIVPNFEQYKFCHDVLLSYTESDSTYANL